MLRETKEQFIALTNFLGTILGTNYEVVFHVIEEDGSYVKAIANGHISGRTVNSPLTAKAAKLIQDKIYLEKDFIYNYKAVANTKAELNGSTFFIKENNELVGIFCVNHDNSAIKSNIQNLLKCLNFDPEDIEQIPKKSINKSLASTEKLSLNINEVIEEYLESSIDISQLKKGFSLSSSQLENIISKLYEKGIFNIKGAIRVTSKKLHISESTVYRYLRDLD